MFKVVVVFNDDDIQHMSTVLKNYLNIGREKTSENIRKRCPNL